MSSIDLFSKDTATSSFIQDVLSSVDYAVSQKSIGDIQGSISPIVIWDMDSFGGESTAALTRVRATSPDTMILAYAEDPEKYAGIPGNLYDIFLSVESLRLHLMSKIARLKEIQKARQIFNERMSHLVGKSESMQALRKTVERAILNSGPVLIQGESGVGKDLVAKAIACMYDKFVVVNCSAIPETLFESELFGHTRGAFTGAQNERIGLFEDANGGAIFLDEIGDMPLHAQVKLLRVIQNKEIRPIGANKTRHIDVRIIAATNRDLREEIFEKRFREDLFYRLNVIPVHISPLRERKEDVEDIAKYFIKQYAPAGEPYTLSPDAVEKLRNHDWPGNIRELENVIQRTLCFTNPGIITADDLQIEEMASHPQYQGQGIATSGIKSYDAFQQMQQQQEIAFLKSKIHECGGSVSLAAEKLGMLRTTLYNRLSRLGVNVKELH
jgi:DNA-binding NtrC family response regulator